MSSREAFRQAAAGGDVEALTALGIDLLTQPPLSPYDGVKAIVEAANAGGGRAIHLCGTMSALGAGLPQDWNVALNCLQRSAERDWKPAQDELRLLAAHPGASDWKTLRDSIDLAALTAPARLRAVHAAPRIAIAENFLSPQFCDWLIARAKPKIVRAGTFDTTTAGGRLDSNRSNSAAEFDIAETDLVLALVRARIADATGLAPSGMEHTQILHYSVGQHFAPHYDFLDPKVPAYARNIAQAGQRMATFLVYLNDDFDGAETAFLKLDWRHRGSKGDAILFWNVDPSGAPDPATLHAGLAPTRGEKWLLSQWIRRGPSAQGA